MPLHLASLGSLRSALPPEKSWGSDSVRGKERKEGQAEVPRETSQQMRRPHLEKPPRSSEMCEAWPRPVLFLRNVPRGDGPRGPSASAQTCPLDREALSGGQWAHRAGTPSRHPGLGQARLLQGCGLHTAPP